MVSDIFGIHPYLGKIPLLTNIFQMGWNHQLDIIQTTHFGQFVWLNYDTNWINPQDQWKTNFSETWYVPTRNANFTVFPNIWKKHIATACRYPDTNGTCISELMGRWFLDRFGSPNHRWLNVDELDISTKLVWLDVHQQYCFLVDTFYQKLHRNLSPQEN